MPILLRCMSPFMALRVGLRDQVVLPIWAAKRTSGARMIILAQCGGDLSNKIIQKGLAFRCEWSGSIPAPEAMSRLWDLAPPA